MIGKELKKYKPEWNIEFFVVKQKIDLVIEETQASRDIIDIYSEIPNYVGITFVLDNLNKIIWTWCSIYQKSKGWAKKLIKEKKPQKFADLVLKQIQEGFKSDLSDYKITKVIEGDHPNEFEQLFLYDIVGYNLYEKHYTKPEYESQFISQEQSKVESATKKCKSCGWILSETKNICPRCKKNPDREPEK